MSYELKNIKLLGYTTDFNQCECCGKENLKGTVSVLDLNSDVVLHFGTTCASNANKFDSLQAAAEMKKMVKEEIAAFKKAEKLAGLKSLEDAIKKAREDYQMTEEKIAYDKQIESKRDIFHPTFESHRAMIQSNIAAGNIARAKRDIIMSNYSIPSDYGYRLG